MFCVAYCYNYWEQGWRKCPACEPYTIHKIILFSPVKEIAAGLEIQYIINIADYFLS